LFALAVVCYGWLDHHAIGDIAMFSAAFLLFGYLASSCVYVAWHTNIRG
jgi:hypothetical protein